MQIFQDENNSFFVCVCLAYGCDRHHHCRFVCVCACQYVCSDYRRQRCQLVSLLTFFVFLWNRFKRFLALRQALNTFIRAQRTHTHRNCLFIESLYMRSTHDYTVDCFDHFNCAFHGGINRFFDREIDIIRSVLKVSIIQLQIKCVREHECVLNWYISWPNWWWWWWLVCWHSHEHNWNTTT